MAAFNMIHHVPSGKKNCGNTNSSHASTQTQLALQGFFNAIIQTDLKKLNSPYTNGFSD